MNKRISLDFKFRCHGNSNENNWPMFKNKRLLFSHNKKSVSPIFLQNWTLPAVTIKPFVFSTIDNNFDFSCHSNEILNQAKILC